jgi:hypothetical protein
MVCSTVRDGNVLTNSLFKDSSCTSDSARCNRCTQRTMSGSAFQEAPREAAQETQMSFVAGESVFPSALLRPRGWRSSERTRSLSRPLSAHACSLRAIKSGA